MIICQNSIRAVLIDERESAAASAYLIKGGVLARRAIAAVRGPLKALPLPRRANIGLTVF